MARRIVGVDTPKIQIQNTATPPATADVGAAEQQWQAAAANNVAAYQEQFRGIQSQMQEVAAKQQAAANAAQAPNALAQVFEGLSKGLEIYSNLKQVSAQENAQKQQAYQQQQKLFEEQRAKQQDTNFSELLGGVNQSMLAVQQAMHTQFDTQGAITAYKQLDAMIDAADISEEQRQQLRRSVFENFQSYQARGLTRQQEITDKYQAAQADNLVQEFNQAISVERGVARTDPQQAGAAIQNALTKFDMAMRQIYQTNLPENVQLTIRAQMLAPIIEMSNVSNEAAALYNATARRYAEADAAIAEINRRAAAEGWSEATRQQAVERVRLFATGQRDIVDVDNNEATQYAIQALQNQRQLQQLQTPTAPRLAQAQLLPAINDILLKRRSLEEWNKPGMEDIYRQLQAAVSAQEQYGDRLPEMRNEQIRLTGTRDTARAEWQQWTTLAQQGDVAIEQAIAANRIGSRAELQQKIEQARIAYDTAQRQLDNATTEYNTAIGILSQFRLQDGIPGLMNYLASPEGQAEQQEVNAALQQAQQLQGSASNFPGSQRTAPQAQRSPTVGIQVVGGDNPTGIPSPRSPFRSSQLRPGDVHITATIKYGSHSDGNALDFAAPGGTSVEIGAMTSGTVVDVNNDGDGGGYGNFVVIRDRRGWHWLYAHNSRNSVSIGQEISQGQLLGYQGNTGASGGDHVHVEVWRDSPGRTLTGGTPIHYSEWLPAIKPEQDTSTATQGVPGMGFPPTQPVNRGANVPEMRQMSLPTDGVVLPSAMLFSNGNVMLPSPGHNDTRMSGNRMPQPQIGVPATQMFSTARPMTGQTATPNNAAYTGRDRANPAANYGYTFLRDNAPVRAKIAQVATRLNVPAQWIADTIALATGGTFNAAQFSNNRAGIGMFTDAFLRSQGTSINEVRAMPMTQQLDLFYRMLAGSNDEYVGRYNRAESMVMAVLSGGDKSRAFARPDSWDGDGAGAYGIWDILRQFGSHAGRRYTTFADVFDPQDLVQDQPNTPFGQNLAAAGGTAPRWTGDGTTVAATELDPRVKAFLDLLAKAEGGYHEQGYRQIVGGGLVNSLANHPDTSRDDNATGRYQFIGSTWASMGQPDFSPASQDRAAARYLDQRGALRRLMSGDIEGAIFAAAPAWRGLPASRGNETYQDRHARWNRATITYQDAIRFYQERLRYYTGGTPPRRG